MPFDFAVKCSKISLRNHISFMILLTSLISFLKNCHSYFGISYFMGIANTWYSRIYFERPYAMRDSGFKNFAHSQKPPSSLYPMRVLCTFIYIYSLFLHITSGNKVQYVNAFQRKLGRKPELSRIYSQRNVKWTLSKSSARVHILAIQYSLEMLDSIHWQLVSDF